MLVSLWQLAAIASPEVSLISVMECLFNTVYALLPIVNAS